MATLTCLLEETAVQLFLAGLVILGKVFVMLSIPEPASRTPHLLQVCPDAHKSGGSVLFSRNCSALCGISTWALSAESLPPRHARFPLLRQLASTVCYQSVLQEILSYAGRALDRVVEGLQSQEDIVPDMSLAFFLRLCSRLEGGKP